MNRKSIYLPDDLRRRLDARAAQEGLSRAPLIRRLAEEELSHEPDDQGGDIAALEASFGILDGWDSPPVRGEDDRMRHLQSTAEG